MKKEISRLLALLLFGAAALSGCAVDSGRYHNRYNNDRHDRGHDNDHNGYHGHNSNNGYNTGGYNHSNY